MGEAITECGVVCECVAYGVCTMLCHEDGEYSCIIFLSMAHPLSIQVQLATLEKQLLQELASSQGNILENTALLRFQRN